MGRDGTATAPLKLSGSVAFAEIDVTNLAMFRNHHCRLVAADTPVDSPTGLSVSQCAVRRGLKRFDVDAGQIG